LSIRQRCTVSSAGRLSVSGDTHKERRSGCVAARAWKLTSDERSKLAHRSGTPTTVAGFGGPTRGDHTRIVIGSADCIRSGLTTQGRHGCHDLPLSAAHSCCAGAAHSPAAIIRGSPRRWPRNRRTRRWCNPSLTPPAHTPRSPASGCTRSASMDSCCGSS